MRNYDTIDIFFIALISAYFITLLCIIISLAYLYISKHFFHHKKNEPEKELKVKKENNIKKEVKTKKDPKTKKEARKKQSLKEKLYQNKLFQKLFMVEVKNNQKETVKPSKAKTNKSDSKTKNSKTSTSKKTSPSPLISSKIKPSPPNKPAENFFLKATFNSTVGSAHKKDPFCTINPG